MRSDPIVLLLPYIFDANRLPTLGPFVGTEGLPIEFHRLESSTTWTASCLKTGSCVVSDVRDIVTRDNRGQIRMDSGSRWKNDV